MPDEPLDVLRLPTTAESPRPEFARQLRARLEAELRGPTPTGGTTMAVTAYLTVHDGAAAIEWYTRVLAARVVGDVFSMSGTPVTDLKAIEGGVGHAEISIGNSTLYLSDEWVEGGVLSPQTLGGTSFGLTLDVATTADVDAVYARAVAEGSSGVREPADQFYGARAGTFVDPFGHRWTVRSSLAEQHATGERFAATELWNEVGYYTIAVPDPARARRFYGELFGWDLPEPAETLPGFTGMHNDATKIPMGFDSAVGERTPRLYFRVRDLDAMVAKVRELGGEVVRVDQYRSGGNAVVRDDQGVEFDLWQPAEGY